MVLFRLFNVVVSAPEIVRPPLAAFMLQQIFSGTDPETAADLYVKISNNAADKQ